MRVWRELRQIAVTAIAVGLVALLSHAWNGSLSAGELAARSAILFAAVLVVQLAYSAVGPAGPQPARDAVFAWVMYALIFGGGSYLLPFDEISVGRAVLGGVLFATVMTPFAWWDFRKAIRRQDKAHDLEDARLDREHDARLARADRTWVPH